MWCVCFQKSRQKRLYWCAVTSLLDQGPQSEHLSRVCVLQATSKDRRRIACREALGQFCVKPSVGDNRGKLVVRWVIKASSVAVAYRQFPALTAIDNINDGGSRHDAADLAHLSSNLHSAVCLPRTCGLATELSRGCRGCRGNAVPLLPLNVPRPAENGLSRVAAIGSILRRSVSKYY
jgi:hypothetical protein